MSDQEKNNNLSVLILGVIIGAAVTYLFTNEKGQKIKDRLVKEGSKLIDKLREDLEQAEEEIQKEKELVSDKVESGVETVKETVQEVAETVPGHIDQIQKKGRRFFFRKPRAES